MVQPTDPTGLLSHLNRQHRGVAWKEPCRVATTATVTISTALNSGDTIDGVTLADGDRVLVKDQSTGNQNGIYIAGTTPTRAYDMDQDGTTDVVAEEIAGAFVYVIAGTANAGKVYHTTNVAGGTLGSTTITWAEFTTGGGGTTITTKDEGSTLSSTVTTLDFVGAGVTASGGGATTTVTIPGSAGGLTSSILGYNTAGGSTAAFATTVALAKKITLSTTSLLTSVGVYMAMTSLAGTGGGVFLYADSSGPTGAPLAVNVFGQQLGSGSLTGIVGASPTTPSWWEFPLSGSFAAGDYWFGVILTFQSTSWQIYYDGSGTDKEITFTDGGYIEGIYRSSVASASRKYSMRLTVLA